MTAKDILLAVIIPVLLAEVGPWCGWLAKRLMPWAAGVRYGNTDRAAVRAEEWSGDVDEIPGQLTKFAYALAQLTAGSAVAASRAAKISVRLRHVTVEPVLPPPVIQWRSTLVGGLQIAFLPAGVPCPLCAARKEQRRLLRA
jgi:hypothetical protein